MVNQKYTYRIIAISKMEGLDISVKDGVKIIKFNKPHRKNAVNKNIYIKLTNILNEDAVNDNIIVTILTGEGDYFTSGNDIKAIMESVDDRDVEVIKKESNKIFKTFIKAFINYPKLLIAVVNGPAVGIGATITGLCDIVYASDNAFFLTPFIHIGLCCEGCSSYMFPFTLGRSKASEMLLLGKKVTAQEAYESNLVARVVPFEKLDLLFTELQSYGKLPLKSVLVNKKLITDGLKNTLHECNNRECEVLLERSSSQDFFDAMIKFMSRKSKL